MAMQNCGFPRRRFLGTLTASGMAAPLLASSLKSATGHNGKIGLGIIGIGPRCTYDLKAMLPFSDVRCLAIADVQATRRDAGKQLVDEFYGNQDCRTYRDFRELLERPDIDAVLIATGDRWHADASMLAAKAGKHVYSEKPCGISMDLCQKLSKTMEETGRVFQAGTQRRSVPNFQQAVEWVHSGRIGKLKKMHASVYIPSLDNQWLPSEPQPSVDQVDWNLWLGPAPWRPFNQKYCDGQWRGQWDFDSGARLLDWGAHTVDLCQWANQADDSGPVSFEPRPTSLLCRYANGVEMEIDFLPNPFGDRAPHYTTRLGTCPVRFIGEEGWIETGDEGEIIGEPKSLLTGQGEPAKRIRGLDVSAHARNFFDCIASGALPVANHRVMRKSHLACHVASIAWILQRKIQYDPIAESILDAPEATPLLSRAQRPWT
ncbi:MAG: Gfo/Idh/MocA family protein [Pirellulaceae bacterium]|jgi:predicted dehydrogenase